MFVCQSIDFAGYQTCYENSMQSNCPVICTVRPLVSPSIADNRGLTVLIFM